MLVFVCGCLVWVEGVGELFMLIELLCCYYVVLDLCEYVLIVVLF